MLPHPKKENTMAKGLGIKCYDSHKYVSHNVVARSSWNMTSLLFRKGEGAYG